MPKRKFIIARQILVAELEQELIRGGDNDKGRFVEGAALPVGVKWFLGSCEEIAGTKRLRGSPPRLAWDPAYAEKLPNGNYLIADHSAQQVYEITPGYKIVWHFGEFSVRGSDLQHLHNPERVVYNPELNRILISDTRNGRVIEIDYDTKKITNVLTSSKKGRFGVVNADYGREGIVLVDRRNHYACEVDWDGNILWEFGEYGTPGSDLGHLDYVGAGSNSVGAVDYIRYWDSYVISDYSNNRVLVVGRDGRVLYIYPTPRPLEVKVDDYVKHIGVGSEADVGYLIEPFGNIIWYSPHRSNMIVSTPEWSVLTAYEMSVYEYDMKSHRPWRKPNSFAESFNLPANTESKVYPWLTFGTREVTIAVLSTQDVILNIYYPNLVAGTYSSSLRVDPNEPWILQDAIKISANRLTLYTLTGVQPIVGVSVKMGDIAGRVKIFIHEE